jgi:hypothetical protein
MFGAHPMFRIGGGGYQITNSLRFRASNSAYLSRTFGSPTSSTVWTFSAWCKRGNLGSTSYLLGASTTTNFGFNSSNQLVLTLNGTTACTSTAVFRDPSAWMHIVYQQNGSAQTIYVNNASVATGTTAAAIFNTAIAHQVGAANTTNFFDGHLANVYWIDGQALTPSSFGQTDATTGVWVPKAYSGTYGTNGFFLEFKDATSTTTIGYDTSGNSNNFTTSGISVTDGGTFDQSLDTPTLNYPVISPLNSQSVVSITEAGMASNYGGAFNTGTCIVSVPFPTTGKWHYEHTCLAVGSFDYFCGVFLNKSIGGVSANIVVPGTSANEYAYRFNGEKMIAGVTSAYGSSYTANDVIGIAFDATNLTIEFFKNNVSQGQLTGMPSGEYIAFTQQYGGGSTRINFGQRPFAYTPPTGFKALSTANITSTAVSTSGTFTGNAAADGPFVWTNGNPATLTINGNPVTFGTHADKTAGGFKLRSSSASYNASGSNSWTATAGKRFVQSRKPNNAQVNP